MAIPLFTEILIILLSSVIVVYWCSSLNIPTIIGFLVVGALIGPHGFAWIHTVHEVEALAEIGVIFLLFTIGIELSIENLTRIWRAIVVGGGLQVGLTIAVVVLILMLYGISVPQTIFIGFLFALSSTAIVFKLLQERAEVESPHGQTTAAILIFQDLIIVPMILVTPMLGGQSENLAYSLPLTLANAFGIIILVLVVGSHLIDVLLHQITRTRNKELFYITVIALCFAITWLTAWAGLSIGLGAFLSGLVVSRSQYSHFALAGVMPFRDMFVSFFFVSIGMLLNGGFTVNNAGLIALLLVSVVIVKTLLCTLSALVAGLPFRASLIVGLSLFQVGEFSFVLSRVGIEHELLSDNGYQLFLSVSILTMVLTPFLIQYAPAMAERLTAWPGFRRLKHGFYGRSQAAQEDEFQKLNDHIVIVGFGLNGRNLACAAKNADIPYMVIEMNPDTVRVEKAAGQPIFYGDSTYPEILEHAHIEHARILVITIADPVANRRTTELARRLNPNIYIITRTRFLQEMKPLVKLGANEVIPEEFETSVEIFTRVLTRYLVPKEEIESYIREIRAEGYGMLRSVSTGVRSTHDLHDWLSDLEVQKVQLEEGNTMVGISLKDSDIRKQYGVMVLSIHRNGQVYANPKPDWVFEAGDILVCLGRPEDLNAFSSREKTTS